MAAPEPPPDAAPDLAVGETREVELYAIRFDVSGYEQVMTKADILGLPKSVREKLWLYDLDLVGHSGTPRLVDNAIGQIKAIPLDDPSLSPAERNMVRLLSMTPDTANLAGTPMEELLDLSPKVGFHPAEVLASAIGIGVEDPFLPNQAVTDAVVELLIGTHPNAQTRYGRPTSQYPDGRYPVPPGHLPMTLEDAASDLAGMTAKFGEYDQGGVYHPGFVAGLTHSKILTDGFKMTVRANANALPFKGLDLSAGRRGNISSIGKDGAELFDFSDPEWIRIEGLAEKVSVAEMTFQILEFPEYLEPGSSPLPGPWGDAESWKAPPWTLERIVTQAAFNAFRQRVFAADYFLADPATPLFHLGIQEGWMELTTQGNLGNPPAPLYLWDLILMTAQVRLHDGPDPDQPELARISEGMAHVGFKLHDVPCGVIANQVADAIRINLEADPSSLISVAGVILDQSGGGSPDLYYYHPRHDAPQAVQGDWLYYITAADIPLAADGSPVKDYGAYPTVGFFSDPDLTAKLSTTAFVDGDAAHEKVQVEVGEVLYAADDTGGVYRIDVLGKPSPSALNLAVTRMK
jgi:hypothetical protein